MDTTREVLTEPMRLWLKGRGPSGDLTVHVLADFITKFELSALDCHLALKQFMQEEQQYREVVPR